MYTLFFLLFGAYVFLSYSLLLETIASLQAGGLLAVGPLSAKKETVPINRGPSSVEVKLKRVKTWG